MKQRGEQRRLGTEAWRGLMAKFANSGLTTHTFCTQEGVSISSFNRWRSRLARVDSAQASAEREGGAPAGPFVELGTLEPPRSPLERFELRLDLGAGVTLHVVRG